MKKYKLYCLIITNQWKNHEGYIDKKELEKFMANGVHEIHLLNGEVFKRSEIKWILQKTEKSLLYSMISHDYALVYVLKANNDNILYEKGSHLVIEKESGLLIK